MGKKISLKNYTTQKVNQLMYREDGISKYIDLERINPLFTLKIDPERAQSYVNLLSNYGGADFDPKIISSGDKSCVYLFGDKEEAEELNKVLKNSSKFNRYDWIIKGDKDYNYSELMRFKFPWGSIVDFDEDKAESEKLGTHEVGINGKASLSDFRKEKALTLDIEVGNWRSEDNWLIYMTALKVKGEPDKDRVFTIYDFEEESIEIENYGEIDVEVLGDEKELLEKLRDYINEVDPLFLVEYSDYDIRKITNASKRYDFDFVISPNGRYPVEKGRKATKKVYTEDGKERGEPYSAKYKVPGSEIIQPIPFIQFLRPYLRNRKLETVSRDERVARSLEPFLEESLKFEKLLSYEEQEEIFQKKKSQGLKREAEYNFWDVLVTEKVFDSIFDVLITSALDSGMSPTDICMKTPNLQSKTLEDGRYFKKEKTVRKLSWRDYLKGLESFDYRKLSEEALGDLIE